MPATPTDALLDVNLLIISDILTRETLFSPCCVSIPHRQRKAAFYVLRPVLGRISGEKNNLHAYRWQQQWQNSVNSLPSRRMSFCRMMSILLKFLCARCKDTVNGLTPI